MNQQQQPFSVQSGFNSNVEPPPENTGSPLLGSRLFRVGWKPGDNQTNIVLLDDAPQIVRRHKISRQGLGKFRDARITCACSTAKEPAPRQCLVCEAALRHDDVIKRKFCAYLTCIDEAQFVSKKTGKSYKDMKYAVELDFTMFETLKKIHEAYGSLVGMRFMVIRDPIKTSKFIGTSWTPLGQVNPMQHFSQSPAIPALIEAASRQGKQINGQQALQQMVSAIDYAKELNNYSPEVAEQFVAVAVSKDYAASGGPQQSYGNMQSQGFGPQPGFQQPQPQQGFPQPQMQPQMQQQYQQPQSMPAAQVPDFSVPQPVMPQAAPQPMMPDPVGAAQPVMAPQQSMPAPAPTSPAPDTPPWNTNTVPAQHTPSVPVQQQSATVGDGYQFGQQSGWQPGFPPPSQPPVQQQQQQQAAPQQQQQQQQQQQAVPRQQVPTVPHIPNPGF